MLLTGKFDLPLNQRLEQFLLVLGELLILPFTLSDDVLFLFVAGHKLLHHLGFLLSDDGLFLGLSSLLSDHVPLLKHASGSPLGHSDLFEDGDSLSVNFFGLLGCFFSLRDVLAGLLSLSQRAVRSIEFSLGNSDGGSSSNASHIRVGWSASNGLGELGFDHTSWVDLSS